MALKDKIGIAAGFVGAPMVIIAQIVILIGGELSSKQKTGAWLTIFCALCVFISIIYQRVKTKKQNTN